MLRGQVTHGSRDALAASLAVEPDAGRADRGAGARPADRCLTVDAPVEDVLAEGEWVHSLVAEQTAAGEFPTDGEAARLLSSLQVRRIRDAAWCTLTRADGRGSTCRTGPTCAGACPAELLAPPATLLGWAAWQAGHGALAWCAADLAAECDPDYTLTHYLAHALEHAIPPTVWESGWDWKEGLTAG